MSWIHIQDWVGAVQHILKNDLLQGPVNMVAPKPVTNAEFTKTLASVLRRPAIFPVPAFAAKLAEWDLLLTPTVPAVAPTLFDHEPSIDELLARVRARLRRSGERNGTVLHAGRLLLDVVRREADVGSGRVPLAEREFLLLQELMRNVGRTVSKEWLLRSVWGYWFASASNVVDVYVARLRRKVGAETIVTVRGEGYRVDAV